VLYIPAYKMRPGAGVQGEKKVVQIGGDRDLKKPTISVISMDKDATTVDMSPVSTPDCELAPEIVTRPWTCHYVMSILTTIVCFGPLSVIGLVHFLSARTEKNRGDYDSAVKHKRTAKFWTMLACITGLLFTVVAVLFCAFIASKFGLIRFSRVQPADYQHDPAAVNFLSDGDNYQHHSDQVIFKPEPTNYPHNPNMVQFLPDNTKATDYPHNPNLVNFLPDKTTDYPHDPNMVHFVSENYPHHPELVRFMTPRYPNRPLVPFHSTPSNGEIKY